MSHVKRARICVLGLVLATMSACPGEHATPDPVSPDTAEAIAPDAGADMVADVVDEGVADVPGDTSSGLLDTTVDPDVSPGIAPGARFVVDITSPRGVTLKTVIIAPAAPAKVAVILLEGGEGLVEVEGTDDPVIKSSGFLARNADTFAAQGLLVVLPGPPSDHPEGIGIDYRISEEQGVDVGAILAWIDAHVSLPVWVVGMSKGSFSAANAAIRLNDSVDGFAVCSASTAPQGGSIAATHPHGILDMELVQIAMPALVVGHQDDSCPGTPPSGVASIAEALTAADPVVQKIFTGGDPPQSQSCGPLSPHGYFGIEDEVVTTMASVMTSQ